MLASAVSPAIAAAGGQDALAGTYLKARQGGRIVSVAAIIAVAANTDGRREIIGLGIGPSEAEPFWLEFLRSLKARGLDGTKLVISDAHGGLKNALAHVSRGQHTVVAAAIRQAGQNISRGNLAPRRRSTP